MQNPRLSELAERHVVAYRDLYKGMQSNGSAFVRKIGDEMEKSMQSLLANRDYLKSREILCDSDEPELVSILDPK